MIIIAEDAASEAERLVQQGTRIKPVRMSPSLIERVSGIDGTIILDPQCVCYAVGVILDGEATSECTPSLGSRFNSAMRYVRSVDKRRLAIVFSDDAEEIIGTIDVLRAANSLYEVPPSYRPHPLKAGYKGCFAVGVTNTHRVVF